MNGTDNNLSLKERIKGRIRRIANILLLNASFIDNLGLLNGKMGIAIFFYHYSRHMNERIFEDYAGELVDEIYEDIRAKTPIDFANGLTGIGWGFEHLATNKFVQADTDVVLSEIDSAIYRVRLNTPCLIDCHDSFFSYGHFYISRIHGCIINDDDLNILIKKYHLVFMIDEVEKIILNKYYLNFKIDSLSIDLLNSLVWFIIEVDVMKIFPSKTHRIIQGFQHHFDNMLIKSENNPETELLIELVDLIRRSQSSTSVGTLNIKRFDRFEIKHEENLSNELDKFNKRTWQKLIYHPHYNSSYQDQKNLTIIEFIDNEENWNKIIALYRDSLSLIGLAGLGLGLLFSLLNEVNHSDTQ